jgi:hypothetical protein
MGRPSQIEYQFYFTPQIFPLPRDGLFDNKITKPRRAIAANGVLSAISLLLILWPESLQVPVPPVQGYLPYASRRYPLSHAGQNICCKISFKKNAPFTSRL